MEKDGFTDREEDMSPHDGGETSEREARLSYAGYTAAGGIINEGDYDDALSRAKVTAPGTIKGTGELQAKHMLEYCRIDPSALRGGVDIKVLYAILRSDTKPREVPHHHSQMHDQVLLREALLMLEEGAAVSALEKAYPNIFHPAG